MPDQKNAPDTVPDVLAQRPGTSSTKPGDGVPDVGRPLDGSEYLDVVEEQQYGGDPGQGSSKRSPDRN